MSTPFFGATSEDAMDAHEECNLLKHHRLEQRASDHPGFPHDYAQLHVQSPWVSQFAAMRAAVYIVLA
jgi:hypothetical protein